MERSVYEPEPALARHLDRNDDCDTSGPGGDMDTTPVFPGMCPLQRTPPMNANDAERSALTRRNLVQLGLASGLMSPAVALGQNRAVARADFRESTSMPVSLIGLPYLLGSSADNLMYSMAQGPRVLFASENGPSALRGYFKDVSVQMLSDMDEPPPPMARGDQMAQILTQNIALAAAVKAARAQGRFPLTAIGACSAALGMVGGLSDVQGDFGMIWIDAHADASTPETTRTGFIEGMVTPIIAGKTWAGYRRSIPGFREIDESRIISLGLSMTRWPRPAGAVGGLIGTPVHKVEIDRDGMAATFGKALTDLKSRCAKVYVHFDVDSIDPAYFNDFRYRPEHKGLTPTQITDAFDLIASQFEILALTFSSFDPLADTRGPGVLVPLMLTGAKAAARSRLLA